jgi:SAM-dependent methyltransferase
MNCPTDWWNGFFTGPFADFWRVAIPEDRTLAEVDFLEQTLRIRPGSSVLDVPCGHGRHSLELARRGYRVTGVDFSSDLLGAARRSAAAEGLTIEWIERDMRSLAESEAFDAAFCAGNSFGYFDDAGNQAFLESTARALGRGGRFLIASGWISESLLPNFRETLDREFSGIRFQAENRYDAAEARVESRFTVSRGGRSETRLAAHRIYTYRELVKMLEAAGFAGFEAFGSPAGEPFVPGSPELLLSATKR